MTGPASVPTEAEIAAQWPGFTVTCNKCGSTLVELDNSMGFSGTSGAWGSIDLTCRTCQATVEIVSSY